MKFGKQQLSKVLLVISLMGFSAVYGQDSAPEIFTSAQKAKIEVIIHDYLIKNPQILVEVSQELQQQQQQSTAIAAQAAIKKNIASLFQNPLDTVGGNLNAKITIIEFTDYQCGYCKRVTPMLAAVIKANPAVRVVLKQMPIFGENSELAAKAVMAAKKQNKAWQFHIALMQSKQHLSEATIFETATAVGLNLANLKTAMADPVYAEQFKKTFELARELKVNGTPAFIVASGTADISGKTTKAIFIPGAVNQAALENAIKELQ